MSQGTEGLRSLAVASLSGDFSSNKDSQWDWAYEGVTCYFCDNVKSVSLNVECSPLWQAMDVGVPVVARDIPGNAAVVQNEVTGLLYSTPQVYSDNNNDQVTTRVKPC